MSKTGSILIADDKIEICDSLAEILSEEGFTCETYYDGEEALEAVKERPFDLVVVDIKMPGATGLDIVSTLSERSPETLSIIITANPSFDSVHQALRKGASDYFVKPFDLTRITERVKSLMNKRKMALEIQYLRKEINRGYNDAQIIGETEAMQELFKEIGVVRAVETTVLITGRSGTGKELVARAIHARDEAADRPFVAVNCAAFAKEVLESELFGYKKGAFTGAEKDKSGLFEAAQDGTIFLDEISEMDLESQAKLLRVLQESEIRPVGSTATKPINARIIAATNRDLEDAVAAGSFREDLYYRLNVFQIKVPSLSERKADIPLLANHFITSYNQKFGRAVKGLSNNALKLLMSYHWPGEVRELRNTMERAVLLCETDFVTAEQFPQQFKNSDELPDITETATLSELMSAFERQVIMNALEKNDQNRAETASELGIDPSTLYRKMKELNLS